MAARFTVHKPSPLQEPELIMTTGRALESQPPSLVGQVLGALFLCRKFLLEIQQAPVFVRIWHDELHLALKNSKLGANWIGIICSELKT